jgi:beta-glucosidase
MAVFEFPQGFLWGAATASYQIEGSPLADGAGASIWHTYSHQSGNIQANDNGDLACDHYRRWADDIGLMRDIGLKAYRFSISWPRILPAGHGRINQAGLGFYDRLVDGLCEAGIEPMATLYHWDLPQALEDEGGWPEEKLAAYYADYGECVFKALGDRVKRWITFNEPWVFVWLGYGLGIHAPGRGDRAEALRAGHNVLRAHGMAVERLRALDAQAEVGLTLSVQAHLPASAKAADIEAADRSDAFHNRWFIDPIRSGRYPEAMHQEFGSLMPAVSADDAALIGRPIDFIGLNYYTRQLIAEEKGGFLGARILRPIGRYTAMDWEIYPAGLYHLLKSFHRRYALPLYVTENGAAIDDEVLDDGKVNDWERMRYLQSHFEAAHRALDEGVDLRGYMVWSLLDNFEWGFGYSKRFGLVRCDYDTLERRPKQSAKWYARVIADNGI